jgi:hypothetical protein
LRRLDLPLTLVVEPVGAIVPWRAVSFVLAGDELYAVRTERIEGVSQERATYQSGFTYDRHEGIPVLRSFAATLKRCVIA